MIRLDSTLRALRVVLGAAPATSQLPIVVTYSDKTATTYTGGTKTTVTTGTTAAVIAAAPAASTVRDIDNISIRNIDTAAATVTVQYLDDVTVFVLIAATLDVGDHVVFTHGSGWQVFDSTGALKTASPSMQPLDATLTALAGLATGADQVPYSTGTDTFAQATITSYARTLLDDTTAVAARSTLQVEALTGRNKIINGKMTIAQRGTSFAAAATGAYTLDRWHIGYVTTGVMTITQNADVPTGNEFQNSLRVEVTTADTAIAVGDAARAGQMVEGFNARDLVGRTFTLSFWVRSSKLGVHCVSFRNTTPDRSYVAEYTILVVNTWEKKTVTVTNGLITAGTWDWTTGIGLRLDFALMMGTNFHTTAGAWQTGSFLSTVNQVNCLDTIGNIFAITGVQIERGVVATEFEHRQHGQELALCQRYYETSYNIGVAPGTATHAGASGMRQSGVNSVFTIVFAVRKRTAPTMVLYNPETGATGSWRDYNAATNVAASVITSITTGELYSAIVVSATDQNQFGGQWAAAAEL